MSRNVGKRQWQGTDFLETSSAAANVVYRRQEDGVWFPSSFGTEFRIHAGPVFFFNRDVSISMKNSGFERKHVETK